MPPQRNKKQHTIDNSTRSSLIDLVIDRGMKVSEVAKLFSLPYSTVRTIVDTFIQTGRDTKLPRGGNRSRRLDQEHIEWLMSLIDENAGQTIPQLHARLNETFQFNPPVSLRTVYKALNSMATYTLKLIRPEPESYNQPEQIDARRQWAESVNRGPENIKNFVYIDETGFILHIHRRFSRAPRGRRAHVRLLENRGPNMSLIVAVDKTGILASWFKRGQPLGRLYVTRQALPEGYHDPYEEGCEEDVGEEAEVDARDQQSNQTTSSEDEVEGDEHEEVRAIWEEDDLDVEPPAPHSLHQSPPPLSRYRKRGHSQEANDPMHGRTIYTPPRTRSGKVRL